MVVSPMNFTTFCERALKIEHLPLPGVTAHRKMSPILRPKEATPYTSGKTHLKQAAVLALFYPDASQQTRLLLILRKKDTGVHANQIGFPGGKVEPYDKNRKETALRETYEEVGALPSGIQIIKELTEVYVQPSHVNVQPYMGIYAKPKPFALQESEVEALVEVYLQEFLDHSNRVAKTLSTSYATNIRVPAYKLNGHTVWGATAMMLSEIQELLHQVL